MNGFCTQYADDLKHQKELGYTTPEACFEECNYAEVDLFYHRADNGKCICYRDSGKGDNCRLKASSGILYLPKKCRLCDKFENSILYISLIFCT